MKKIFLIAAGLAVGAVMFWPAASLEGMAQAALPSGSRVSLSGSIWNGEGVMSMNGVSLPLTWRFRPSSISGLRLGWAVDSASALATAHADVSQGFDGIEIANPGFHGDAALLGSLMPMMKLAGLKGRVSLESAETLRLQPTRPWQATGQGMLVIQDAVVAMLSANPTGTHRIELKGQGDSLAFEIKKSEGPLTLEGKGTLNNRNELAFSGSALPLSTLEPEARAQLARWAPLQSDGRYRIDVKTKW